jgi:triphosphoribosyl-dephospho-CoA synthase
MYDESLGFSAGQLAQLACIAEVSANKPGNVHVNAAFADTNWLDFVASAVAIGPVLDRAEELGVGQTVLRCVRATQAVVRHNTNLGIILLLAPLCAVPLDEPLEPGLVGVLDELTQADADAVFEAIALARPGGLGRVEQGDVRNRPQMGLIEAMKLAAGRDAVARQYANGYDEVLHRITPDLVTLATRYPLEAAITWVHVAQMGAEPDSLIRRKCGDEVAAECQERAAKVFEAALRGDTDTRDKLAELDRFLRADGNRRNPGTSADLVAAGVFVALRNGSIKLPTTWAQKPKPI